ncbi:MAG: radical SAM family heme chaperone HemW [Planctomycetaceae bacterium]|nr:radical SAM family heme chaperone HemW [Planctomycetaceae bacterium]
MNRFPGCGIGSGHPPHASPAASCRGRCASRIIAGGQAPTSRSPTRVLSSPLVSSEILISPHDGATTPVRRPASDAGNRVPRSAYIHVPFCAHRCGYCDFTLVARRDDLVTPYLDALEQDLQTLADPQPVDTLFFGGGTPTHLDPAALRRLIELACGWFPLHDAAEFSVEANPFGLDEEKIAVLADGGVNRVSLGVQSFDLEMLRFLERDHTGDDALHVVDRVRRRIENVSLDLIFGVPGQTRELWQQTLDQAIALAPAHISTYGLTFEKGTTFWSRRLKGTIAPVPDDLERAMYGDAMDRLTAAGFVQYELSNFARPGRECRHNQTYWRQDPYFGHGPGAARYLRGKRSMNHRSVTTWIRRIQAGESPIAEIDELSPEDRAREAIYLGLRQADGVSRRELFERTGFHLDDLAAAAIREHVGAGLLSDDGESLRLTREGRFLADTVSGDFL